MINTRDYKARTELVERNNGKVEGVWEIALDAGYSESKIFSPNMYGCFPSFAKRIPEEVEFTTKTPANAIQYRDEDGNLWAVGELAYNKLERGDTSDSEAALFGRERYISPSWKVMTDAGLALGMLKNNHGGPDSNDRFFIQTGLPERYLSDSDELIGSLAGAHRFSLKIGGRPWQNFSFGISKDDIAVMSQPKGTLFSVCIDRNGKMHPEAHMYLTSSGLVFDPGFGTLDVFPVINGAVGQGETFSDLGMKRVMQETAKLIKERYGEDLSVIQLQKDLESGKIRHVDLRRFKSEEYPFADLLETATKMVCDEAIERLATSISLADYNYMIVTGGTGAAWYPYIQEKFKDFTTIKLIKGNQNDNLPFLYANCRGYYLYRYNRLARDAK